MVEGKELIPALPSGWQNSHIEQLSTASWGTGNNEWNQALSPGTPTQIASMSTGISSKPNGFLKKYIKNVKSHITVNVMIFFCKISISEYFHIPGLLNATKGDTEF